MTLKDFQQQVNEGKVAMGSQLAMRNENIQVRKRVHRYTKLKREKAKVSRLVVPKEIALDFDPRTGEVTEEFNADTKFRPMIAPSEFALILKELADTVPGTKERIMAKAGVDSWDTSDYKKLTDEDKAVFRPYLYPMIYTVPIFTTTLKTMSKNAYGTSYIIKVDRDPVTNRVVGEEPLPILANYFFRAVAQEEINELKESAKNDATLTDAQLKDKIRQINDARVMVSSDFPSNWIRVLEIPLDASTMDVMPTCKLSAVTDESFSDFVCLSRYTTELRETISKFRAGAWKNRDVNFDFYEFDMVCPLNADNPADVGRNTRYERVEYPLAEKEGFSQFMKVYYDVFGRDENAEQTVLTSTYFKNYDDTIEKRLLEACSLEIDLKSKYLTDNVILSNQDFLTAVFAEEADDLIMRADAGISGREQGTYSAEQVKKDDKEYDLNKMAELEDMDLDMEEIEE